MVNCSDCQSTENLYILQCSHYICLDCIQERSCVYNNHKHLIENPIFKCPSRHCDTPFSWYVPYPFTDDDVKYNHLPIAVPDNDPVECPFCLQHETRRHRLLCPMRPMSCPNKKCDAALYPCLFSSKEDSYNDVVRLACRILFPPSIVWQIIYDHIKDDGRPSALSKSAFVPMARQGDYDWRIRVRSFFKRYQMYFGFQAPRQSTRVRWYVMVSNM